MTEATGGAGQVTRPMPRYKSHKEVHALKIVRVENTTEGGTLYPEDRSYDKIQVDFPYMAKHNPFEGGYYVVYKDGYKSFSPAEAFEDGYTRVD